MGYYTQFRVEVVRGKVDLTMLAHKLYDISGYYFDLANKNSIASQEEIKWYDWSEHMTIISKEFSNVIFCVYGVGEEPGDVWRCYFDNGEHDYIKGVTTFRETTLDLGRDLEPEELMETRTFNVTWSKTCTMKHTIEVPKNFDTWPESMQLEHIDERAHANVPNDSFSELKIETY